MRGISYRGGYKNGNPFTQGQGPSPGPRPWAVLYAPNGGIIGCDRYIPSVAIGDMAPLIRHGKTFSFSSKGLLRLSGHNDPRQYIVLQGIKMTAFVCYLRNNSYLCSLKGYENK